MPTKTELNKLPISIESEKLESYILKNLRSSLKSIGFSPQMIEGLVFSLLNNEFESFLERYSNSLTEVYDIGFFQHYVAEYFLKYVVPHIPPSRRIIDLGCGAGILVNTLSTFQEYEKILGIDINSYPEWKLFHNEKIEFKVVNDVQFKSVVELERPDTIILTWTLHHMTRGEQEKYAKDMFDSLNRGSKLIILEDAYSEKKNPRVGKSIWKSFMNFTKGERHKIMSVYDYIANRILARREIIPTPFSYRTLEEWVKLFEDVGFITEKKYLLDFQSTETLTLHRVCLHLENDLEKIYFL